MKYLYQMGEKISLLCYIPMMYQLWHLCQYGGLRKHLPILVFWMMACSSTLFLWLIARRTFKKNMKGNHKKSKYHYFEILIFVVITVFFCGKIIYSAIPYHGALSWKLDEAVRQRKVVLEHNNIFEDGVEGILADLDQKLDLPEELYIFDTFSIRFNKDGTVQKISTFLYGKNKKNEIKTYLVDYDANKSDRMSVWLDGNINGQFKEDMRLDPMLSILKNAKWKKMVDSWSNNEKAQQYEILYAGRRDFAVKDGLYYLPGDADGDGIDSGTNCISKLDFGGNIVGFEVSLHIPKLDKITPVRYIMEPTYTTLKQIKDKHIEQQVEQAKNTMNWILDRNDGSMYFFLDDLRGWRLSVVDAAAGSRFYAMEKTEDGGVSWKSLNQNPFLGQSGTAEGLLFYDENVGVASISGASQSSSMLYLTKDGGASFQQIQLPMNQVSELPKTAKEYGFTIKDYDYLKMPELSKDALKIKVTPDASEEDGIIFYSTDIGETWTYQGVWNKK